MSADLGTIGGVQWQINAAGLFLASAGGSTVGGLTPQSAIGGLTQALQRRGETALADEIFNNLTAGVYDSVREPPEPSAAGSSAAADPQAAANASTSDATSLANNSSDLSDQEQQRLLNSAAANDNAEPIATGRPQLTFDQLGEYVGSEVQGPLTVQIVGADQYGTVGTGSSASAAAVNVHLPPLPNRLLSYPSYVYSLSLHMLTPQAYNDVVVTQTYVPQNVIVASAGRHGTDLPRNPYFNVDFYFDDFNMTTVIGITETYGATNAVDINFTLLEPNGFSFLNRLIRAANALKIEEYLTTPYLLQIDFFAIKDDGGISDPLVQLQKRIPITIVTMDTAITTRGSEYRITAAAYTSNAYNVTTVSTPANFEITASTVGEFWQSVEGTDADTMKLAQAYLSSQQRNETTQTQTNTTPQVQTQPVGGAGSFGTTRRIFRDTFGNPTATNQAPASQASTNTATASKKYITAKSYGTAINTYYKALADRNKTRLADVYRFEFLKDPLTGLDISTANFTTALRNTPSRSPMLGLNGAVAILRANANEQAKIYDANYATFQINYGTSIVQLLEYVIRNSSYIMDQVVVPDGLTAEDYASKKAALQDKPLNWFKIVPTVRILGFDDRTQTYAREITYTVKPYKIYNLRSEIGPQGVVTNPVKTYNYIFTGKNDDILDCDIKFNLLYYIAQTAYRNSLTEVTPTADAGTVDYQFTNSGTYTGADENAVNSNSVSPTRIKPVVQNTPQRATGGAVSPLETGASDLADSILNRSEADMVSVRLKILGDPDYIKQDELFYAPNTWHQSQINPRPQDDPRLLPNSGSMVMDEGGVYVELIFATANDYDESTGLLEKVSSENSVFSGIYQVVTVNSQFNQGQFTQDLEMVRMPRQAIDYVNANRPNADSRPESGATASVLQQSVKPPESFVQVVETGFPRQSQIDTLGGTRGSEQPVANINNNEPTEQTQEQLDLAEVNATAAEKPITQQTEPVATPPPNESTQAAAARLIYQRGKLADQQISINNELSNLRFRESGVVDRPLTAADRQRLQQLQAQYNALNTQIDAIDAQIKNLRGQ